MFIENTIQNENDEDVLKVAEKMTYGAIDELLTHRRSVGGNPIYVDDMIPMKDRGILTMCGDMEGITARLSIDGPS